MARSPGTASEVRRSASTNRQLGYTAASPLAGSWKGFGCSSMPRVRRSPVSRVPASTSSRASPTAGSATSTRVCNEGVGFSVCAGAWLGGMKTALIMENSGLRVAAEYIARISLGAGVPVTLMLSYRGDIGETEHWAIPHGIVVESLLDALRIKYQIVRDPADLRQAIVRAHRLSEAQLHPAAVLVSGSCIWED